MSLRRVATAVTALAIAFTASTATTYALWSTTGSATFTVTLHTPPGTVPGAPTDLACTLKQAGQNPSTVELRWIGPNDIDYRVYRVGVSAPVHTTKNTRTGQLEASAFLAPDADGTYSVTVRAVVGGVESLDSQVLTFGFAENGCG